MKKQDIKIGGIYMAKITNKIVPVRIEREHTSGGTAGGTSGGGASGGGGWHGTNLMTNRPVRIKSAAKLRREAHVVTEGDTVATGAKDEPKIPTAAKDKPNATGANTGKTGRKPKCKGLVRYKTDPKTGKKIDQATGKTVDPRKKTPKPKTTTSKSPNTTAKTKAPKQMSILDAAAKVLGECQKPEVALSCAEMIERMQAKKYWTPRQGGKTPDRTLYSAILREIGKKGKDARFRKTDRGRFALVGGKDS